MCRYGMLYYIATFCKKTRFTYHITRITYYKIIPLCFDIVSIKLFVFFFVFSSGTGNKKMSINNCLLNRVPHSPSILSILRNYEKKNLQVQHNVKMRF